MWPMAVSALRPASPPPPPPEAADKSGHRSSPTPSETLLVTNIKASFIKVICTLIGLVQYGGGGGNNVDLARWPVIGPPFGGGGGGGGGIGLRRAETASSGLITIPTEALCIHLL
ncbi:hypothetical protein MTR67_016773 [Solanum verrucosum]|uniref:Uncharacterized protein n=1 Tax=Solanum verrucosum TaxID=315347 RepID=A0AAF0QJ29_SOLVR|nr:hypothetical protein MTR67_016773 [Solanum verrucosum]